VISFVNATLVLSVGETVEEVSDSGFWNGTQTLNVHQIGEDALLQVFSLVLIYFLAIYCK
jgi:splicing factor 3B subunit 3